MTVDLTKFLSGEHQRLTPPMQPYMRFSLRRDVAEIIAIDEASFADPLSESDFIALVKQTQVISMCVEYDNRVIGYVVYELHKHRINILRLAVHPEFRRTSVATIILDKIKSKLHNTGRYDTKRTAVTVSVPDDNLPAHLLLRSAGFVCLGVKRKHLDADQYEFVFDVSWLDIS